MTKAFNESKSYEFKMEDWTTPEWEKIKKIDEKHRKQGVNIDLLKEIGK